MDQSTANLQALLTRLGYLRQPFAEREMDDATRAALRLFQRLHGMPETDDPDMPTWERLFGVDARGESVLIGEVTDGALPIGHAAITVQDRDLGDQGNWPTLGTLVTGPDGRFTLLYQTAQVAPGDHVVDGAPIADLVFTVREVPEALRGFEAIELYRLPDETRVTADEQALGFQAGRLAQLRIVLRFARRPWAAGASEYERLLAAFREVWPNVVPAQLDDQRREPEFVARELGVPRTQVQALVAASRVRSRVFDGTVSEPILYGLARSDQHLLDAGTLAVAGASQIKRGILQAVDRFIIPPQTDDAIVHAIERIADFAARAALGDQAAGGYAAVLSGALPEQAQQTALLTAARGRATDPVAMWTAAAATPALADARTIARAQFALQLDPLTNRHLPLMSALQRDGIASTRAMLDLGPDRLKDMVSRPDVGVPPGVDGDDPEQQTAAYVTGVTGQLHQAFPTETTAMRIAALPAAALGGEAVRGSVAAAMTRATTSERKDAGTALDLGTTHIDTYLAAHPDVIADVAEGDRPAVVSALKKTQRLYRVSTGPEALDWLVKTGFNSAFDIAQIPNQMFVERAGPEIGETQALMMHNRAVNTSAAMLTTYVQLRDLLTGVFPAAINDGREWAESTGAIKDSIVKYLPTWSSLFGDRSFCACADCRSVYSPAAYLVDLLNSLDHSAIGGTPLDVLLARRPDLAQLKLTCENTNVALPYVDLVNEVLESLVVSLDQKAIPAHDIEGATSAELQAAPRFTNWDAYVTPAAPGTRPRLDRAVYPPSLPFDAPLDAARTYLRHLGAGRADLMAAFDGPAMDNARAAECLGLSPATFAVVTGTKLDGTPSDLPGTVDDRYGWEPRLLPSVKLGDKGAAVWALKRKLNTIGAALPIGADPAAEAFDAATTTAVQTFQTANGLAATGIVDAAVWTALAGIEPSLASGLLSKATSFLERARVSFDDLLGVLKTRHINPERMTFDVIQQLTLPGADVLAFAAGGFAAPSADLTAALTAAGVTIEAFTAWARAHLDGEPMARLRKTVVDDGPVDRPCNLDAVTLRHWDAAAPAIETDEWLKVDRFLRLQRATGLSVDDLDLLLSSLQATAITAAVVRQIAQAVLLSRALELSIAQVVALWGDLDPTRAGSLYAQRFRSRTVSRNDPAFEPTWSGQVLADTKVGDHVSALQAGLRCSAADLEALRTFLALGDGVDLDVAVVSRLFRHVLFARALGVNVRDLVRMLTLTGIEPFVAPADDWAAAAFVSAVREVQGTNLNAAQLTDVLADLTALSENDTRDRAIDALRTGLQAMTADFDAAAETVDGTLTRRALSLLNIDARLIDQVLQDIRGTDRVITALPRAAVPPPAIPFEWAPRLSYAASPEPSLSMLGTLTDAEQALVGGFSADDEYHNAVTRIGAEPRTTIQTLANALAAQGIVLHNPGDLFAVSLFVDKPEDREAIVRARLTSVLHDVLPAVVDRLKRSLVKQTLGTQLQFDAATIALLLEQDAVAGRPALPAQNPASPLIADFLDGETAADLTVARRGYELLARVHVLIEGLTLQPVDVEALAREVRSLRSMPMRLCEYDDWRTIAAYARLLARPFANTQLAALWEQAAEADAQALLGAALGWPDGLAAALMAPAGLGVGLVELRDVRKLERLVAAGDLVQRLGVTFAQAVRWARGSIDQTRADEAQRAVKAKYDEKSWLEAGKMLSDALRESRRSALVAYLLPGLNVRTADMLYERLLIDVQTTPAVMTSRIKQAISSVQLFTERCLLNLEPDVPPAAIDAQHWKWLRNYRVWEANRKILLYPENWIRPELRDDKTPFFKQLESELLQNDVTDANVETLVRDYLAKLDDVAKLEIVAMHVQESFEAEEKLRTVVHVFGRTANPPESYFYRRYVVSDSGMTSWTPWEKVPVDIQGTLIVPIVFHRRLYVFWASLEAKSKDANPNASKAQAPEYVQEIHLSWSEYRHGAWLPKHTTATDQFLREDYDPTKAPGTSVQGLPRPAAVIERLDARLDGNTLRVLCVLTRDLLWTDEEKHLSHTSHIQIDAEGNPTTVDGNQGYQASLGSFVLDACHGQLRADDQLDQYWRSDGVYLRLANGALEAKPLAAKPLSPIPVLGTTYDGTALVDDSWIHNTAGYVVFSDTSRTYFGELTSIKVSGHDLVATPKLAYPDHIGALVQEPKIGNKVTADPTFLKATRTNAEVASNAWASASASMATMMIAARAEPVTTAQPTALTRLSADRSVIAAEYSSKIGAAVTRASGFTIKFQPLFHPFACAFLERLEQTGIPGVLTLGNQQLVLAPPFASRYAPRESVLRPYPVDGIDFGALETPGVYRTTAYSAYNWELFFHIPMLVADRLTQNQRFEDADRWLRYVFDPTDGRGSYWKVLPFAQTPAVTIDAWLQQLNAGHPELQRQIAEWKDHPFEPHRIARMRLTSYQKYVVMQYLDNLIAWGDNLFGRDTLESINDATLRYVMAGNLLGPALIRLTPRGEPEATTFSEMRGKLDALSNVAAEFENTFPHVNSATAAPAQDTAGLLGISKSLYFCVPPNDKLLAYWDTVADRLFKIRNSMNLAGVVRSLPLFEPPIDPALLVKAAAQGIDLNSVLTEMSAPLPCYRFSYSLQRALDACADVRALGAALLGAIEKRDAENLAALRASQETTILRAGLDAAKKREEEAQAQIAALEIGRNVPVARLIHYRGLMGVEDLTPPASGAQIPAIAYNPKLSSEGGVFLIDQEIQDLSSSHSARDWQVRASFMEILAGISHYIPSFSVECAPFGVGAIVEFGGQHIGPALMAIARQQTSLAGQDAYDASHAAKMAGYQRRQQEFALQANLAGREIMHIDRQITVAQVHSSIATLERQQHETRIAQAELMEDRLLHKYTNAELYGWMQGQIASVYFAAYQLAYDLAKRAERCFRFEAGLTSSDYVRFGSWDSLRKGLLAGEQLQLQLRQLERAYHDQHRRDFELTRHVSLLQLDPVALVRLKETGRCEIDLPEWLYDLDNPGHYMRRIKSMSISIPAVAGPFTSVNATLTMLANRTRVSSALRSGRYEMDLENEDARFVDDFAAIQAIATSTGQNDNGMFELNFRDERYLPFEGAGAISRWWIELDPDCNRFELDTVSDVVLHVKYTARAGGEALRAKAKERWKKVVADAENTQLARLFSLKHEFPTEWYRLRTVAAANGDRTQMIALTSDQFPMLFQSARLNVASLDLIGVPAAGKHPTKLPTVHTPKPDNALVELKVGAPIDLLLHMTGDAVVAVKDGVDDANWTLTIAGTDVAVSIDQLDDLLLVCHYFVAPKP